MKESGATPWRHMRLVLAAAQTVAKIHTHLEQAHAVLQVAQEMVKGMLKALEVGVVEVGRVHDGPVDGVVNDVEHSVSGVLQGTRTRRDCSTCCPGQCLWAARDARIS